MKRPQLASAAVILMAAALASGVVDAHGAKTKESAAAPPSENKVEQSAPSEITGPAMMMPGSRMGRLMMPSMDPSRGKELFVDKGCIACHAVNGVGGHDAPTMDAHEMDKMMNPFEFPAKMWNHAPGMIAAQEEAFGEMINFTGEELANIIAFVHHDESQHGFSERNLTPMARKMMEHEHGGMSAPASHAEEIGHGHADELEHTDIHNMPDKHHAPTN